jgi:D-alanyl-D-alanine-carboxypeptidase/D-alanyl-D-alanine-endopeptidase
VAPDVIATGAASPHERLCLRVMRIVIRLLAAAVLGYGSAAMAQEGAALSAPVTDYLARATAQGTWPQLTVAHVSPSAQTLTRFPAGANAAADEALMLGDGAAALTGLLLADLASSGRVRLDDPVSRFLPEGLDCADARVCAITLQQLATHTSGLPPLPTNLFPGVEADIWRGYREGDLLEFLANYRLPSNPVPRESALGSVLLGWLLGRAHGEGYATALAERVSRPLGLKDTRSDDASIAALPSHVRSSLVDLSKLLVAMLRPGESPLRAALMLSRQPRDAQSTWGLGWRIAIAREDEQEWPLVWQSAQADGSSIFFGFRTDRQQAIAFDARGSTSLAPLGLAVLGSDRLPPLPAVSVPLTTDPAEYAGLYESGPGLQLLIRSSSAGLSIQSTGRLALRLKPLGPDLFVVDGAAIRLSFQRDARGVIDSLRWSENGVIVPVRRLSSRAPVLARTEIAVDAAKRIAYCGDYAVDTDVIARLQCGTQLTLQFSGAQPRELFAYAEDRFASRDGELELAASRDADGQVAALTLVVLGNETTLQRTRWTSLPAAAGAALADERRRRDAAATAVRDAADERPPVPREAAPWIRDLPVLQPTSALPYRRPGTHTTSAHAAAPAAGGSVTASVPAVAPAKRTGDSANVRAAPAAAPARVETLPEKFERPRFAPRADDKAKEASDDGT